MAKTKNKPFKNWLYDDVEQAFGLIRLYKHQLWIEFENLHLDKKHKHIPVIEELRETLFTYVDSWNEDELKFMFISPFINLVKYVGCYVSGRSWFFVVLEDKEYAVSNAFNATNNDIFQIFAILLFFKQKTEERFASRDDY